MKNILIEFKSEIIALIVMMLLFFAFLCFAYNLSVDLDKTKWNEGHCDTCGGTWEYEQAVGHRSYTSYIYVCNNCGKRIEVNEVR